MSNVSRNEMLVGVDIGTSKVVAIVAEARGDQLEIIGLGTHSSKGMQCLQILLGGGQKVWFQICLQRECIQTRLILSRTKRKQGVLRNS